ncbi:MAG: nickel-responsive transcriptional regulator NikR [Smithellaceae bacterium]|nr:nickel-responsive transcriptional regulator NikR [Smithellaceae bacterium]
MSGVIRFGVSIDSALLHKFDALIEAKGYTNRSEALRDLIRDSMVQAESELGTKEMIGTITIVYNHHTRELTDTLTDLQHRYFHNIISTTHIHMDKHNCLEVLIARGRGNEIRSIAELLIGARGVKHGKFTLTSTGRDLT